MLDFGNGWLAREYLFAWQELANMMLWFIMDRPSWYWNFSDAEM